jgi:ubiquinone/menaquinone biosynthesis C-methylase UbiE
MKKEKDSYGQQVWDFLQGKESYEIIERDDGFIDTSFRGPRDYFADFKSWSKIQKKAIKFAKGKVLDIGAGAGRVSLYLQEKGLSVVAIDNSPFSIKVCKKRGVKVAKVLPIEELEKLKGTLFNTIILYGNNFGLFANFKKAQKILKKMYKITTPDALIIAETTNPYKTKDPDHLAYHAWNKKRKRMSGQIRIRVRFKKYAGDWFDYLFVSKKEMKEILKGTGWKIKETIDSDTSLYIAVIEKDKLINKK